MTGGVRAVKISSEFLHRNSCDERTGAVLQDKVILPSNCLTDIMAGLCCHSALLSAVSELAGVGLSVFTTTATDTIGCADAGPGFVEDEGQGDLYCRKIVISTH